MPKEKVRVIMQTDSGAVRIQCVGGCGAHVTVETSKPGLTVDKLIFTCADCNGIKTKYAVPTEAATNPRTLDPSQTKLTESKKK